MCPRSRRAAASCCALLFVLAAGSANAAVTRAGERVVIGPGEVVEEDLYVAANQIRIEGEVRGDLIVAAQDLEITGKVTGDLLAVTGKTRLSGTVLGSLRVATGRLELSGRVGQDLVSANGNAEFSSAADVGRDLMLASGEAQAAGRIGGDLRIAAGKLLLGATVTGAADVATGTLELTPQASVGGPLRYRSEEEARIPPGAKVASVERIPLEGRKQGPVLAIWGWARAVVAFSALGALLLFVAPRTTRSAGTVLRERPWRSLGFGALALFATPILAALVIALGALIGGWWLGLVVLGVLSLAIPVALSVSGLFLGRLVLETFERRDASTVLALVGGVALLMLGIRLPVLGPPLALAAVLLGLGALVLGGSGLRRETLRPTPG